MERVDGWVDGWMGGRFGGTLFLTRDPKRRLREKCHLGAAFFPRAIFFLPFLGGLLNRRAQYRS